MQTDTDTLHFLDDDQPVGDAKELVWRLMVVDDEPDVHRATTFALTGVKILGRPLEFLHAYSAVEAENLLKTERDVAASAAGDQYISDAGESDDFSDGTGEAGSNLY